MEHFSIESLQFCSETSYCLNCCGKKSNVKQISGFPNRSILLGNGLHWCDGVKSSAAAALCNCYSLLIPLLNVQNCFSQTDLRTKSLTCHQCNTLHAKLGFLTSLPSPSLAITIRYQVCLLLWYQSLTLRTNASVSIGDV